MARTYWETLKKEWRKLAEFGLPLAIFLFAFWAEAGMIDITGHSGDMVCAGTEEDPCYAKVNFTVTANESIFLYKTDYDPYGRNVNLTSFDKPLSDWELQRSWGDHWRTIPLDEGCTGSWCGCYWCRTDNTAEYAYAFRPDRSYEMRIVGYKENPEDDVKWTFGPLDPTWYGTTSTQTGNPVTIMPSNYAFSSATLYGNVEYMPNSSENILFQYRQSGDSTWINTTKRTIDSDGVYNENLTGLTNGTKYEYRFVMENENTSSTSTFITYYVGSKLKILSPSNIQLNSTTLNGKVYGVRGHDEYDVFFQHREQGASTWTNTTKQTFTSDAQEVSENIDGLSADTGYEYRMLVEGGDYTFETSTTQFTTEKYVQVETQRAASFKHSARLIGNLTELNIASVDVYFQYREQGTSIWSNTTKESVTSRGEFNRSISLTNDTTYEYRAMAEGGSYSSQGSTKTLTTDTELHAAVTYPRGHVIHEDSTTSDNLINLTGTVEDKTGYVSGADVTKFIDYGWTDFTCSDIIDLDNGTYICEYDTTDSGYGWHDVEMKVNNPQTGVITNHYLNDALNHNSLPRLTNLDVTPVSGYKNDEFNFSWELSDSDGDDNTMTLWWRKKGNVEWNFMDSTVDDPPWSQYAMSLNNTFASFNVSEYEWMMKTEDVNGGTYNSTASQTFTLKNRPPDQPLNPSPTDGETDVSPNAELSVDVADPDGHLMDVTFYGNSNNVGEDTSLSTGSTASTTWDGLKDDTTYTWYVEVNDGYSTTTSNTFTFTTTGESVRINGSLKSRGVEWGNPININATTENNTKEVCLSHSYFGKNYTCNDGFVSDVFDAKAHQWKFNDSTEEKNFTSDSNVTYLEFDDYSGHEEAYIDIYGYNKNGSYPSNLKIFINNEKVSSFPGTLKKGEARIDTFVNGSERNVTIPFDGGSDDIYFEILKNANISNATMNIWGLGEFYDIFETKSLSTTGFIDELEYQDWINKSVSQQYVDITDSNQESDIIYEVSGSKNKIDYAYFHVYEQYGGGGGATVTNMSIQQYNFDTDTWEEIHYFDYKSAQGYECHENSTTLLDGEQYISDGKKKVKAVFGTWNDTDNDYCVGISDVGCGSWYSSDAVCTALADFNISGEKAYADDPFVDTAESGSPAEWNYSGEYNTSASPSEVDLDKNILNNFLDECLADKDGICKVPLSLGASSGGKLKASDLYVNYTTGGWNPVEISGFNATNSNISTVNLSITSDSWGKVEVSDINISYYGQQDYEVNATSGSSVNTTNYTVYYSNFTLGKAHDWMGFYPDTSPDYNVTPYGQGSDTPFWNITSQVWEHDFNIDIKLNETWNCQNITASTNNSKSDGKMLNTTYQNYYRNVSPQSHKPTWFWLDWNCSGVYTPDFDIESTCVGCL